MKSIKLSLLTFLVACSTNSFASESLSNTLQTGKVSGEVKVWNWNRTIDSGGSKKNYNSLNTALELGYITNSYKGFKIGATFQANSTPFIKEDAKNVFKFEQSPTGSVLSEAFIDYNNNNNYIKVGRQYINSPLLYGNDKRIYTEAYQGITIENNSIEKTKLFAAYINKFQAQSPYTITHELGDNPFFTNKAYFAGAAKVQTKFNGAYAFNFENKSINNLKIKGGLLYANNVAPSTTHIDDLSTFYGEINYKLPNDSYILGLDLRYKKSFTGENLDSYNWEGAMTEMRLSAIDKKKGLVFSVAYSTVTDSDSAVIGIGGIKTYTLPFIRGPFYYTTNKGTDSYAYSIKYNFQKSGIPGLKGIIQYATAETDDDYGNKEEYKAYAALLNYKIPIIKGLNLKVVYSSMDKKVSNTKINELWTNLVYKF